MVLVKTTTTKRPLGGATAQEGRRRTFHPQRRKASRVSGFWYLALLLLARPSDAWPRRSSPATTTSTTSTTTLPPPRGPHVVLAGASSGSSFPNRLRKWRHRKNPWVVGRQRCAALLEEIWDQIRKHPHALYSVSFAEWLLWIARRYHQSLTVVVVLLNAGLFGWKQVLLSTSANHPEQRRQVQSFFLRHFSQFRHPYLRQGVNAHTYLTSAFDHATWSHLLSNLHALALFGRPTEKAQGPRTFAYFVTTAAVGSSLLNEWIFEPLASRSARGGPSRRISMVPAPDGRGTLAVLPDVQTSRGASGVVAALQMYACLSFPWEPLQPLFTTAVRMDTLLATVGSVLVEWQLLHSPKQQDNVDHGVHLGGYLLGAIWKLVEVVVGRYGTRLWRNRRGQPPQQQQLLAPPQLDQQPPPPPRPEQQQQFEHPLAPETANKQHLQPGPSTDHQQQPEVKDEEKEESFQLQDNSIEAKHHEEQQEAVLGTPPKLEENETENDEE